MEVVRSVRGVPIRLTSERWLHIVENHDDLETVAEPDLVLSGEGALLAIRAVDERHALVVVYREVTTRDGFVITAFQTSKLTRLRRQWSILWRSTPSKRR